MAPAAQEKQSPFLPFRDWPGNYGQTPFFSLPQSEKCHLLQNPYVNTHSPSLSAYPCCAPSLALIWSRATELKP